MRRFGVGLIGLVAGLAVGFLVHELVARAILEDGPMSDSIVLALFLGFVSPALAIAGAVTALWIDSRRARRRQNRLEE